MDKEGQIVTKIYNHIIDPYIYHFLCHRIKLLNCHAELVSASDYLQAPETSSGRHRM